MVGPKQVVPAANIENGKQGWTLLAGISPEGKADPDHTWVGHEHYGWTRVPDSNVKYVRYWAPDDAMIPAGLKA